MPERGGASGSTRPIVSPSAGVVAVIARRAVTTTVPESRTVTRKLPATASLARTAGWDLSTAGFVSALLATKNFSVPGARRLEHDRPEEEILLAAKGSGRLAQRGHGRIPTPPVLQ